MPVFIYICTYCVTLWNKMSLTCWLYTLNSPVEGSPASRKRQFGFTSLPNDNGGKKLFPIICSKHLSLRAYMLTHWKTTLKYMHGLDLMILLKNKKFYKFWTNESFDVSCSNGYSCDAILSYFYSVQSTQVNVATYLSFFMMHFHFENASRIIEE